MKHFNHQRTEEKREAEHLAWIEIEQHEAATKAALPKPTPRPNWLNPMGADDYIKNRRLVEMPMTQEERDDMCRRDTRRDA
jgi:hypothetical protein